MHCNKRGELALIEGLIIVGLIGYAVFMTYKWAMKPVETQQFKADSKPIIIEAKPGFGGCASVDIERERDSVLNKVAH